MIKNTAGQKVGAHMITAADGTAFTSAVTVYVTGDAGTQAAGSVGSGACTHEGNGYHTYAPAQAETNYDLVDFTFIGTGAVPEGVSFYTGLATPDVNVATWNGLTTVALPLVPTTAGRTLDVSTGGEAGVDWANVGAPTTTLNLSGTTVKTATDVATALATVDGIVDDILVDTAVIGAAGAGLTALGDTRMANLDATVSSRASQTSVDDLPTNAELATSQAAADDATLSAIAAISATIGAAGAGLTAVGDARLANLDASVSTRSSQTSVDDLPTNAELATALGTADDAILAAIAALNNLSSAQVGTEITTAALATAASLVTAQAAITLIKAKTDSLTFTSAGQVDAAVKRLNLTPLNGDGGATPWGP